MLWPHHQRTIDRLVAQFESDPAFPALIVAGSLTKGLGREDSDVDIMLVASDEEYARRAPEHAYQYFTTELCDYPGGYVDGKIVDVAFLRDCAERGNEPVRAAFVGAYLAYCHLPEVAELLPRIPVYPEHERQQKMELFYAQVQAMQWYVGEAEKRHDTYLMQHMVSDLVLFGGRLILAYNKTLYPYHKWFMTALRAAPEKPDDFMALIDDLLAHPSKAAADALCESLYGFTAWPVPPEGWPSRFMQDVEWLWRSGRAPLADW